MSNRSYRREVERYEGRRNQSFSGYGQQQQPPWQGGGYGFSNNQAPPPQIIYVGGERRRRRPLGRNTIIGGLIVALIGVGAVVDHKLDKDFLRCVEHPGVANCLGGFALKLGGHSTPGASTAGVEQDSYAIREKFNVNCATSVTARVNVTAAKHYEILGVQTASSEISKADYGEVELCGNNNTVAETAKVWKNAKGKTLSATAHYPAIVPEFAHLAALDPRNCANISATTSEPEALAIIKEWNEQKAAGKNPACHDGYKMSGQFATFGAKLETIIPLSERAATIALALDADVPKNLEASAVATIDADERNELKGMEPAGTRIRMIAAPTETFAQTLQLRLDEIAPDLKLVDDTTTFIIGKQGELALETKESGGGIATADFTDPGLAHITGTQLAGFNHELTMALDDAREPAGA
jgi:hypothetical protein